MYERIPQSIGRNIAFMAYLSSDHLTPATGKTIAITISKNVAAFGNPSAGATNATEIANGWYYFAASATDTGTVGMMLVNGTGSGIDAVNLGFDVVNANTGELAALPNTAVTTNGSLITSGTGTDQISLSAGKVLLQATQSGVTIPTVTTVGTLTTYTGNTPQTGDTYARIGAPVGASISADIAALPTLTGIFTTAMTEAYASQGGTLTLAKALYGITQQLGQQSITGSTMTVKKRDGTTTAKTYTLNDATTPTAITEAT